MLEVTRKEIDKIDNQILKLLANRLELCRKIGEFKKMNDLPVQNKERENEAVKERIKKFKELGFDDEEFVQELFGLIMKKARQVQK